MTDNTTPAATAETLPYKNPDLPAGERIADLLSRMTLEEKVGQMMQLDARGGDLEDLIVNKHVGSILHTSPEDLSRAAKTVNEKTRLGIPLIIGETASMDTPSGRAPLFSRPSSAWLSAGIRTRSRPPAVLPPRRSLVPVYIGRFLLCCASPEIPVGGVWTRPSAKTRC